MKNVKTDTIVRTIVLALALINQLLSASGKSVLPISDGQVESIVTGVITVTSALWAWWKNNSFTDEAIAADRWLANLKAAKKSEKSEE